MPHCRNDPLHFWESNSCNPLCLETLVSSSNYVKSWYNLSIWIWLLLWAALLLHQTQNCWIAQRIGTPIYWLYGYVLLYRVWFSSHFVNDRVKKKNVLGHKQGAKFKRVQNKRFWKGPNFETDAIFLKQMLYPKHSSWCIKHIKKYSTKFAKNRVCFSCSESRTGYHFNVYSDEGLTLETLAKHHIPQAINIPYQPLLIKPIFSVLAQAEKQFFSKLGFQYHFKAFLGQKHYSVTLLGFQRHTPTP